MFYVLQMSDPTVGVDFFARTIQIPNGPRIKLQLWDTAGQERFRWVDLIRYPSKCIRLIAVTFNRSITKSYYRNSVGALLIYDVTKRASFEHIPIWMNDAKRHIEPHRPVFVLVGCKLDLVTEQCTRLAVFILINWKITPTFLMLLLMLFPRLAFSF